MTETAGTTSGRLTSLDTLRGFDMLFIMGFTGFLTQFLTALGCRAPWLETQFQHVAWHGLRFEDTIFPLFLFLAGVSWPFSLASARGKGRTDGQIHRKILFRMAALVLLGWIHDNILQFDWEHQRLASVIGRIGIAWAVAAFLYMHTRVRTQVALAALFLVGYWALIRFVPNPDAVIPPGMTPLSCRDYCICGYMDRTFLTVCKPGFDGGAFATLGMPVTAMFGALTGWWLRREGLGEGRKTLAMFAAAAALAVLAVLWLPWCPNIKAIWTPTYALVAGSIALALLALFHWLVDVKGWRAWAYFGVVIGMNAITIYMLQKFVSFPAMSKFFFGGVASLCSPDVGKVVLAAGRVAIVWLLLLFFARKRIFLKV